MSSPPVWLSFYRGTSVSLVESPAAKQHLAPYGAAAAPERESILAGVLMNEMMQEQG